MTQEKKESENKEITVQQVQADIELGQNGMPAPKTVGDQLRLCGLYVKSGLVPVHFDTKEKLFMAMMFARELGLNEYIALRQIYVVNNLPCIYGDLPLALAIRTGQLESIDEYFMDEKQKKISAENGNLLSMPMAAVCVMKRANLPAMTSYFTMEMAKMAGLYPNTKKEAAWNKYPDKMMMYRARSKNVKTLFADAISGASILEYDYNSTIDTVKSDVINVSNRTAIEDFNNKYSKENNS